MTTIPPTIPSVQAFLTTQDVQQLIRVDKSTIYRMAESGRIPAIKVGRQWRFPADDIRRWLQDQGSALAIADAEVRLPTAAHDLAALFADLFGVMVVVTDIEGHPITPPVNPCGYFASIADQPEALDRCLAEWRAMSSEYDLEPHLRPSHMGFLCTRAFVRRGNELTGMVIVGGIAPDEWPPSDPEIEAIAGELGVDPKRLTANIEAVYRLEPDKQAALIPGVLRLAKHLSRLANRDRDQENNGARSEL
jgi:excisionase family DNA binding protein